ncbi:MAG: hypothetical protein JWO59_22, partial [Chloroflexi bacterium]|nr:hypothetical protein [Chloroflexota bacterium]
RPAIVWYDGRAEAEAEELLAAVDLADWYRRTGMVLDAHYLAPMYAWVARHEPELLVREHRICSAKDALVHTLTGAWATDPSTASGYGVYAPLQGSWDVALCTLAGIAPDRLPRVAEPWSVVGTLTDDWRATGLPAGLPVITGAGDALTGVFGAGAAAPHTLAIINGTSSSLVVSCDAPLLDPAHRFLLTPHAVPGLWGLEMDLLATGSALRWLSGILSASPDADIFARAASASPGAHGLIAVPYLAGGEQGALWDAHAPAAFVGLTLSHKPQDLARALLEGIVFEMRRCLQVWEQAGVRVDEVVVSGGFDHRFFAPLAAAVLDRPVRVAPGRTGSALGAALLAGLGSGAWDVETVTALAGRYAGERIKPSPDESARYGELYMRYERTSSILRAHGGSVA